MFAYCKNNPVNMIDPSGHFPKLSKLFKMFLDIVKSVFSFGDKIKSVNENAEEFTEKAHTTVDGIRLIHTDNTVNIGVTQGRAKVRDVKGVKPEHKEQYKNRCIDAYDLMLLMHSGIEDKMWSDITQEKRNELMEGMYFGDKQFWFHTVGVSRPIIIKDFIGYFIESSIDMVM